MEDLAEKDIELLSAYLDGELDAAQTKALKERMLAEPHLRRELEAMQSADEMLSAFAGQIDDRPLPEALDRIIGESEGTQGGHVQQQAYGFFAAAAAVFLLVGGFFITQEQPEDFAWLDDLPSGKRLETENGYVEVIATFRQVDGSICREVISPTNQAVLCRSESEVREGADWQIMLDVARSDVPAGSFQPAGANQAIDAYVSEHIDGAVLSAEEERQLIENNWHD